MTPVSPDVSVLLPARNAAPTLAACLRSLERQTLTGWECMVIDDGSTDRTRAIALEAAGRDPRFRVVSIAHAGLIGALNTGLPHCRGRYIARMDADDLMRRDRLAAQASMLDADSGLAGVGCHVHIFPRRAMSEMRREYEACRPWGSSRERITCAPRERRDVAGREPGPVHGPVRGG